MNAIRGATSGAQGVWMNSARRSLASLSRGCAFPAMTNWIESALPRSVSIRSRSRRPQLLVGDALDRRPRCRVVLARVPLVTQVPVEQLAHGPGHPRRDVHAVRDMCDGDVLVALR